MGEESEPFALVIGGGSGIGAALAARYRAAGTTAVVWDVDGERDVTCDVAEPDEVDEAVGVTSLRWGVPSWVTVTAGIGHAGMLPRRRARRLRPGHARERPGPLARACGPGSGPCSSGSVAGSFVAVSSVSARLVDPGMGLYCASKAALSMLVKVAAAEWGPLGLRVNGVGPGVTRTPMLGRGPRRRSKARLGSPAWPSGRPSAVWARPTTWPPRSSPSTAWTGSPARCSSATAGSRCAARSTPSPPWGRAGGADARLTRRARTDPRTGPRSALRRRDESVADDGEESHAGGLPAWAAAWQVAADERHHRLGGHVAAHGPGVLGPLQEHLDGAAQVVLDPGGRRLEFDTRAGDGDQEVALGRALLDDVLEEAEEGGRRRPPRRPGRCASAVRPTRRSSRIASHSFSFVGKWR